MKKIILSLSFLTCLIAFFATSARVEAYPTVQIAYQVKVAFRTHMGINPHYGAFFNFNYGSDEHYLGPGGDAETCGSNHGCISTWNWWGNTYDVLLIPKSWYNEGADQKNPDHYQATMQCC